MTDAEYAVMFHVWDTVVQSRDVLADYAAEYPPNVVTSSLSAADCLAAIDVLVGHGLLVELTQADIDADLAHWRAETRPVSWGVERSRSVGDVDVTEAGFRLREQSSPPSRERVGYEQAPRLIRALGEIDEACEREAQSIIERVLPAGEKWVRDGATRECGPWWHSRYELVPTGFEILLRRID